MASPSKYNLGAIKRFFSQLNAGGDIPNESDEDEIIKSQVKINKQIEKQLKKDKKRLQYTHRLQLLGLENSGKSTLIKQMQIANKYLEDKSVRQEIAGRIKEQLVQNVFRFVKQLDSLNEISDEQYLSKLQWISEQNPNNLGENRETFLQVVKELWADFQDFQESWESKSQTSPEFRSFIYFLNKLDQISHPDYDPNAEDYLRLYASNASRGIIETDFKLEGITFVLLEFHCSKRIIMDNDVMAFIFLVDISEYDVIINAESEMSMLREALFLFKRFWYEPALKEKSVILLLNKVDLFEDKISHNPNQFYAQFPEYAAYRSKCKFSDKERKKFKTGHELEMAALRMFLKDLFLQITWNKTSDGVRHHCYVHFTNTIYTKEIYTLIHNSCRDILQREHLKMHEIL